MAQNSARNAVRKAEGEQELQCWERLYETVTVLQTADISALDQDGNAEHAAMKVAVLEELSQLFQESNFLRNLWTQLLLLSNRRRLTADSYLREIVSLPRLLANVYRLDLPNWLSESHYHRTVTKAALIAAAGTTNDSSTILLESLSRVLASFPSRMLIHLLDLLAKGLAKNVCDNHITLTNFTQDADGMNKTQLDKATVQVLCQVQSLDLAEQLLKLITSQNNKVGTVGFSNSSAIEYYQLFEIIVECAWQKNNYDQVVELLFLNHSYDPVVASILSHYCPDACVFHSLDLILTVWTEKHFHTNSKLKRQRYLTAAVLQLLQRLPSNCLYARSTSDVAMNIVVSHGISNYLECNDKELRSFGMRVAEALGRSLQQEVAFNELKEYDNQNPSSNLAALIAYDFCRVKADTANVLLANTNVALTKSRHESTVAADDTFLAEDSDEDSEIEGYRIAEELPAKDKYLETNYLRDCLELLQTPEDKQDAYKKIDSALRRIPRIMETHPSDATELATPLIKQLINTQNSFNIEDFDEIISTAVVSIVMQVPSVGIDYLTNILKVGDVPLPVKINVISWLASSAVVMSRTNGHALHDTEDRKLIESAMDSISPIGSTTVRRPKRLLQLKSKTTLFRNSFHEVSDSMFYPLLSTLLASLNGKRRTERHLKFVPEQLTIDNIFRISSNEGIDQSSYKEEVSVGSPNVLASIEGIDALLPSQAMIALSTIAECCQNSLKARKYASELLKIAYMYREASDIGLRRAVTISIFYGIKVLLLSNALSSPRRTQGTIQSGSSVLSSLLNVSSSMDSALLVEDSSGITNDIMANSIAVAAIDWVMTTIQTETDEHSFGIKQKILVLLRDNINW